MHETVSGNGVAFGDEAHVVISTGAISTGAQGYQGSLWFGSSDHPAGGSTAGAGNQFVWRNAGIASTSGTADTGAASATGNLEFYTNSASGTASKRLTIEAGGNAVFTGTVTGTTLTGTSLDINGAADISGALTVGGDVKIQKNSPILDIGTSNTSTGNARLNFFSKNTNGNAFALEYNKNGGGAGEDQLEFIDGSGNANFKFVNGGAAIFAGAVTWSGGGSANANTAYGWGDHGLSAQDKTDIGNLSGTNTGDQTTVSGSSGSCTGLAATATALATARNIGGVSFNGTAAIDLPGVNAAGNQNTTGTAAGLSATLAIASGGTAATNSNGWLNSRITTSADGSLNYDAASAVAVNHDSLAGFVAAEHVDWAGSGAGTIHASNYIENVVGNLGVTANGTSLTVTTTNGTSIALPAATTSAWGVMTDEMFDAIAANTVKGDLVVDADEGTKGLIEIASVEEATAGNDEGKAVTAAGLAAHVESRKVHELTAPTAALSMNSQKVTGVADPTAAQDAATKAYTDAKTWNWNDITAGTAPTFNQNTTGSARTLSVARAIYGNNFDGSTAVTGTIATAYIADDAITEDKLANTLLAEIDANTTKNTSPSVYGEYLKLIPSDFATNGDGGNTKFGSAFDKTAGASTYGIRVADSNAELFTFVSIPEGYESNSC